MWPGKWVRGSHGSANWFPCFLRGFPCSPSGAHGHPGVLLAFPPPNCTNHTLDFLSFTKHCTIPAGHRLRSLQRMGNETRRPRFRLQATKMARPRSHIHAIIITKPSPEVLGGKRVWEGMGRPRRRHSQEDPEAERESGDEVQEQGK